MRTPLMVLLVACGAPSEPSIDGVSDADTGTDVFGGLTAPTVVRLPAVEVDAAAPSAELLLGADHLTDPLSVVTEGPFEVSGDLGPVDPGGRTLTVTYTGSMAVAANHAGLATLSQGTQVLDIPLAAVVMVPDLPASATWTDDGLGLSTFVELPSAPYPEPGGAWDDPTVWIRVPHGLKAPFSTVTHLHGHGAVLRETLASQQLPELFAAAGRNAVVLVPQGPVAAASGDFGKLMEPQGYAHLVRDAIALAYAEGVVEVPDSEGGVLTSHSGGYLATAAIIEDGGLPFDEVHLYDSLYGQSAVYEAFALGGGGLRSVFTSNGGTVDDNEALADTLSAAGLAVGDTFSDAALRTDPVIIGWSPASHGEVMEDDRLMQRWLQAALPPDGWAPPELLAVHSDGGSAAVHWRDEGLEIVVEGSDDGGASWVELGRGRGGSVTVSAAERVRVRQDGGNPSDTYPASGASWLVVDGFDRFLGGSFSGHTHSFAADLGEGLSSASGASNEAVVEGRVDLSDYDAVLWMLGDESTADHTFTNAEEGVLEAFVDGGGTLVVSGAEVGYATSGSFLQGVLHAGYVADDAGTTEAGSYTFGVAYPEDYPDVLSGETTLWAYATGGGAAVVWGDRVVVVGFPLETLDPADRPSALAELAAAVGR